MPTTRYLITLLFTLSITAPAAALDEEGRAVIRLANDEYQRIVNETPVVTDRALTDYVAGVARRLLPKEEPLEKGVRLEVTLLDKAMPELYSLANGRIMMTTGALFSLANEAQLAALLSHEVAHIRENHYAGIYQAFKAKERKARSAALAAGIAGVVVEQAMDFAFDAATEKVYADAESGDISYRDAMTKVHAMELGAGAVAGFQEVYQNLPPETRTGSGDPRVPLEMVADAEGLKLLVGAGYDPTEAGDGWRNARKALEKAKRTDSEALAMSFLPPAFRKLMGGINDPMGGISAEALTRTISQNPPDRANLLDSLAKSTEIAALTKGRKLTVGREAFNDHVGDYMLGDARRAYEQGDWPKAKQFYQSAWDAGIQTAEVATALGEAQLAGFAFAATEQEKERAEHYMLKAIEIDNRSPAPYKALGELYGEWERYEEGAKMYQTYLRLAPKAKDRSRIERQIRKLQRKAGR